MRLLGPLVAIILLIILISYLVGQIPKLAPQFKSTFNIPTSTFQYNTGNASSSNTVIRQDSTSTSAH